ncbi:hypothetical protein L6205_19490 [Pseudomonas syringae pv. syringae]|uniref:hypothetical protein n=1 Tax=Pseudomonas syringae TaxID=317 RepID=UPI001F0D312E|nr:hypothetical protein [Pseudomonas syringae]MCH5531328.1 hypothetical protein [Pseudomonas syringae pv. syringae]MCH5541389.1 hypothetical protein [Pseudomonas syringae pv. syringae]MCH5546403.1 hypothetical protein [Pseudomonas syringae pv. syringae]MCH5604764.1 hypothetical protein [Pseudomonas syringae pv. syringae]MCH5609650.1 hypothetical protein [Pseudomonas syringae pv. syringae]
MELSLNNVGANVLRSLVDGKTPQEVIEASRIDFGVAVTAYLNQPEIMGFSLVGRIYFDHKDRFASGRLIRTSDISDFVERSGYLLAYTLNQSVYVLICPRSELLRVLKDEDRGHVAHC